MFYAFADLSRPCWEVLLPSRTDVRDQLTSGGTDVIECPAGTGRYYTVGLVDDVARGFDNEYRLAYVYRAYVWTSPIP
jgi:hypothetical protein